VVGGTGRDESVHWWALGLLVYHLITGESLVASSKGLTLCMRLRNQVVGGTGHDKSVDWWALGVVVYHLGVLVHHLITGESLNSHW
jgi:serine/threonine protein kinase